MEGKIKINLGCGRKILDGWINVDTAIRNGKQPDVEADIRELPFHENYADEVMAIHVIEHFYLWEVDAVLKEWIRVLKPGGKLILECPDVVKACWYMIDAVSNLKEPTQQLTMWPLYGDPSHKDPLMCHRWGWTPQTLGRKLEEHGMTDIKETPAQFHMKELRDMRIEAIK